MKGSLQYKTKAILPFFPHFQFLPWIFKLFSDMRFNFSAQSSVRATQPFHIDAALLYCNSGFSFRVVKSKQTHNPNIRLVLSSSYLKCTSFFPQRGGKANLPCEDPQSGCVGEQGMLWYQWFLLPPPHAMMENWVYLSFHICFFNKWKLLPSYKTHRRNRDWVGTTCFYLLVFFNLSIWGLGSRTPCLQRKVSLCQKSRDPPESDCFATSQEVSKHCSAHHFPAWCSQVPLCFFCFSLLACTGVSRQWSADCQKQIILD